MDENKTLELGAADDASASRQLSQMADALLGRHFFGFSTTDAWRPTVNLYETPEAFLVCVDLAGMEKRDIDVQVENNQLIVRGTRNSPTPPTNSKSVAVHLMEIDHGAFGRTGEIPSNVDAKGILAGYDAGMLWITLPKKGAEAARPAARRTKVTRGGAGATRADPARANPVKAGR